LNVVGSVIVVLNTI